VGNLDGGDGATSPGTDDTASQRALARTREDRGGSRDLPGPGQCAGDTLGAATLGALEPGPNNGVGSSGRQRLNQLPERTRRQCRPGQQREQPHQGRPWR
jgi:hypothetical protein